VLSALNILGVVLGKWTQNLLSLAKVLGLGGIVVAGLGWGQPGAWTVTKTVTPDYATAIILVLYAYGGWNDAAFVASECRERRTIVRALIVGTILITVVYLAVNFAYIQALTFQGVRDSIAVAAATLARPLGETGAKAMSLLVMISALGAINGLIYTGSRVYASMGADHSVFALLGRWHPQLGSPLWSLLVQAVISLAFIVSVGTAAGRDGINSVLNGIGIPAIPWDKYFGGFDTLFAGTAPVFWSFFLLTGLSVFILRWRDPGIERPFRVPLYPLLPLIFCATCVFGIYAAGKYAGWVVLLGVVPLVVGLPLYFVSTKRGSPAEPTTPAAHAGA
jgi:amino acid transporter